MTALPDSVPLDYSIFSVSSFSAACVAASLPPALAAWLRPWCLLLQLRAREHQARLPRMTRPHDGVVPTPSRRRAARPRRRTAAITLAGSGMPGLRERQWITLKLDKPAVVRESPFLRCEG